MGFNCLKARATWRRQFTFYHKVPRNPWYSFHRPRKDERLSRTWSYPVVLNTEPLDWESSTLATRPCNRVFMERKILQITVKRSQSSLWIPGRLLWFTICSGLIWDLSQNRMLLYITIYFLSIFFVVFHQNFVFIIFISVLDELSNFGNRISTNQKPEYVIRNCQRNCM